MKATFIINDGQNVRTLTINGKSVYLASAEGINLGLSHLAFARTDLNGTAAMDAEVRRVALLAAKRPHADGILFLSRTLKLNAATIK